MMKHESCTTESRFRDTVSNMHVTWEMLISVCMPLRVFRRTLEIQGAFPDRPLRRLIIWPSTPVLAYEFCYRQVDCLLPVRLTFFLYYFAVSSFSQVGSSTAVSALEYAYGRQKLVPSFSRRFFSSASHSPAEWKRQVHVTSDKSWRTHLAAREQCKYIGSHRTLPTSVQ